jgi:hypothetical protein
MEQAVQSAIKQERDWHIQEGCMVVEQPARVIVEAFEEEAGITMFIRKTKLWRIFAVCGGGGVFKQGRYISGHSFKNNLWKLWE